MSGVDATADIPVTATSTNDPQLISLPDTKIVTYGVADYELVERNGIRSIKVNQAGTYKVQGNIGIRCVNYKAAYFRVGIVKINSAGTVASITSTTEAIENSADNVSIAGVFAIGARILSLNAGDVIALGASRAGATTGDGSDLRVAYDGNTALFVERVDN